MLNGEEVKTICDWLLDNLSLMVQIGLPLLVWFWIYCESNSEIMCNLFDLLPISKQSYRIFLSLGHENYS